MASASRGPTPKNPASKPPAPARNPPPRVYSVPAWSGSGSYSRSRSQPRSSGSPDIASRPAATISHRSSGESTPPGYRQLMPTIANGSPGSLFVAEAAFCPGAARSPASPVAAALMSGWFQPMVGGPPRAEPVGERAGHIDRVERAESVRSERLASHNRPDATARGLRDELPHAVLDLGRAPRCRGRAATRLGFAGGVGLGSSLGLDGRRLPEPGRFWILAGQEPGPARLALDLPACGRRDSGRRGQDERGYREAVLF